MAKILRLVTFLVGITSPIFIGNSIAKPVKINGWCKTSDVVGELGEKCEVLAVDGFRTIRSGVSGKLKAGFVVYGFKPIGKPIEWQNDTEVYWVFCSKTTPIVMSYGDKGLIVGTINYDVPVIAQIASTALYENQCPSHSATPQSVNEPLLEKMLISVINPLDVLK